MHILFRAIITGFGLRVGAELAKQLTKRIFVEEEDTASDEDKKKEEEAEDDELPTVNPDPPSFDN